jgi:ferredoxin
MAIKIIIDRAACDGFGNCVHAAEHLFALGDDGIAMLKAGAADSATLEDVQRAAYDCPTSAISFIEA